MLFYDSAIMKSLTSSRARVHGRGRVPCPSRVHVRGRSPLRGRAQYPWRGRGRGPARSRGGDARGGPARGRPRSAADPRRAPSLTPRALRDACLLFSGSNSMKY